MRQLLGKIRAKEPNVVQEIYLSELIRCSECQRTVPIGIEVITIKKDGEAKKAPQARILLPRPWL